MFSFLLFSLSAYSLYYLSITILSGITFISKKREKLTIKIFETCFSSTLFYHDKVPISLHCSRHRRRKTQLPSSQVASLSVSAYSPRGCSSAQQPSRVLSRTSVHRILPAQKSRTICSLQIGCFSVKQNQTSFTSDKESEKLSAEQSGIETIVRRLRGESVVQN